MSKFKPSRTIAPARNPARGPRPTQVVRPNTYEAEPVPAQSIAVEEETVGGVQNIGFYAVMAFVFLRLSFLHEFLSVKLHADLHLVILVGGTAYLLCLISGRAFRAYEERSTWYWTGFLFCMGLATVTSFWKGGSFPILMGVLQTVFPVLIIVPALVVTRAQIKTTFNMIGIAAALTIILGTLSDSFETGRVSIGMQGSEIQDSNDYAAHLLYLLPPLVYWAFRPGRFFLYKIAGAAFVAMFLRQILSSGSRGGLISIIVTAMYLVFTGSNKIRAAILIGVPILVLTALPFVPAASLSRLETLFSSSAAAQDEEATASREARMILLKESWKITLERPLTGVGPGEFQDFQGQSAKDKGQRGMWHVTHNSYTEVSSECGLPALILFLGAISLTFTNLRKVAKSGDPDLAPIASTVMVSLVSYSVCIFFLSQAYSIKLMALSALAVSMKMRLTADGKLPAQGNAGALQGAAEPVTV